LGGKVIVGSLTIDERKVVETLWMEQRPLSYADLRILSGKRTVHAVKKHVHILPSLNSRNAFLKDCSFVRSAGLGYGLQLRKKQR